MKFTKRYNSQLPTKILRELLLNRWTTLSIVLTALLAWEILAHYKLISPAFFPPPTVIGATLLEQIFSGKLLMRLQPTLRRLFIGFFFGGSIGLILGLSMGWSSSLRKTLDPIIAALHPVPKITILPLILIIFGIGENSRVIVISISAFFPMLINSMAGVLEINPTLFEVVRNYKAKRFAILSQLILPGSLPFVLTGARLSLNRSLVISIAMEMVFSDEGIGEMIWFAWQTMRTEELYVGIFTISMIGVGLSSLVKLLSRYLTPWNQHV